MRGKTPPLGDTHLKKINHFQNDLRINKCRKNERRMNMTQFMNETNRKFEVANQEFIRINVTWKCTI